PPTKGETHSGGKIIGGGFGCGPQHTRFSAPGLMMPLACPVWNGIIEFPFTFGLISFLPSKAHRFPPPAWHPNGAGPLLKVPCRACPIIISPTEGRIGGRTTRSFRELSFARVKVPAEPPLIVHVPGWSGG